MSGPNPNRHTLGSCHCGNISFTLFWPDGRPTIPARACGCTHCVKHGAAWTSNPKGWFRLRVADHSQVTQYRFGTKTADFHVCANCGVVPIVTCMIDGARYGVLNVNAFDGVAKSQIEISATTFEGETTEIRLARRRRNWTPEARD